MTFFEKIKSKKGVISIDISAFIALIAFYILGEIGVDNVWNSNVKIFLLVLASIVILITLFIPYLCICDHTRKPNTLMFVLSILLIILGFAIAYSMIYYIDFPNNIQTFRYPDSGSTALLLLDFIYYSVSTFTTLGFGDITPISNLAKVYTIIEVLIFVVYISIIVLNLVRSTDTEDVTASSISVDKNNSLKM